MSRQKRQMTAQTMVAVLKANAVRALENDKEQIPTEQERVLATEGSSCARQCHVDKEGFVTTQASP